MDQNDSDAGGSGYLSPEDYQRMNEKEKDAEITRAIIRLQTNIRKILYLTEAERPGRKTSGSRDREKEKTKKKENDAEPST